MLQCLSHNLADAQHIYMVGCKALDPMLFDSMPLIQINIPNTNIHHILRPHPPRHPPKPPNTPIINPQKMRKWHPMIPRVGTPPGIDNIRMGIHPDHLQLGVLAHQGMDGARADGVIAANCDEYLLLVVGFVEDLLDAVVEVLEGWVQDVEIGYVGGVWGCVGWGLVDVAVVDYLDVVVVIEGVE